MCLQNLREYKKTDHAICFGWYAGYTSEASPSQGLHFTGLPDSLDIVSLWSGIPSNNPAYVETSYYNERYLPTAYEEMNYIRITTTHNKCQETGEQKIYIISFHILHYLSNQLFIRHIPPVS